jgi:hypothetical protein
LLASFLKVLVIVVAGARVKPLKESEKKNNNDNACDN